MANVPVINWEKIEIKKLFGEKVAKERNKVNIWHARKKDREKPEKGKKKSLPNNVIFSCYCFNTEIAPQVKRK